MLDSRERTVMAAQWSRWSLACGYGGFQIRSKGDSTDLLRRGSVEPFVAGCWAGSSISAVGSLMMRIWSWCYVGEGKRGRTGAGKRWRTCDSPEYSRYLPNDRARTWMPGRLTVERRRAVAECNVTGDSGSLVQAHNGEASARGREAEICWDADATARLRLLSYRIIDVPAD
jgi:hypothetical protein